MRGGIMNEFMVELFIDNGNSQIKELSSLNEKEMNQWKVNLEQRALSEYHNQKVKISEQKI